MMNSPAVMTKMAFLTTPPGEMVGCLVSRGCSRLTFGLGRVESLVEGVFGEGDRKCEKPSKFDSKALKVSRSHGV